MIDGSEQPQQAQADVAPTRQIGPAPALEHDEAERCAQFLLQLDPSGVPADEGARLDAIVREGIARGLISGGVAVSMLVEIANDGPVTIWLER